MLSASAADRTVRQWDSSTSMQKRSFLPDRNNVTSVSFAKDAKTFLTLHADSAMYPWTAETGRYSRLVNPSPPRRGMPPPPPILAVTITPDGRGVYAVNVDRILYWTFNSTKPTPARSVSRARDAIDTERPFVISDSGRALFHGSNEVLVVNLATGKELWRIKNDGDVAFVSATLSLDGSMAFTSGHAGAIFWDPETGKELKKLAATERFPASAFSANGRYLITGDNRGVVRLFKVESGEEIKRFTSHEQVVRSLAISADGRFAVSGSADATVRMWEMPEEVHTKKD